MYINYPSALKMCGLQTLSARRQARCLSFALKSVKHYRNQRLFTLTEKSSEHYTRNKEVFHVNFARTEDYKRSTIPFSLMGTKAWKYYCTVNDNLFRCITEFEINPIN